MENNSKNTNQDWLSKLPKDSGYTVPNGYFNSVEEHFSAKLVEQYLSVENGFTTPESYFDSLESKIIEQVEFPKKGKLVPLRKKIIQFIPAGAAAAVLLFLSINIFVTQDIEPSSEEIAAWFEKNISSITNDDLSFVLTDQDFEDSSFLDDAIDTEEISKYLDENDTYILIEDSDISINELN